MPLYSVVRESAAKICRARMDEPTAVVRAALRNVLRFTGLTILLAACACTAAPGETTHTLTYASDQVHADITIRIPRGHDRDVPAYERGVTVTLQVLSEWLEPFPDRTLLIEPAATRWWTAAASMAPETAAARATVRRYFERLIDTRKLPGPIADALVEYATRRAVSKIVDRNYLAFYLRREEGRYFSGFVPRDLRIQIPVEGGAGRDLQTIFTLERWVGRPVFDAILLEFITSSAGTQPTIDDFAAVASRVSGQDLTWFFDATWRQSGVFDYVVDHLESTPEDGGRFHTTVIVRRAGDAVFGRGLPLVTTFADGESVRDTVDGRRSTQTFEYRSPSRAVSAEVDPDRVLLVDVNRGNNGVTLDARPASAAANRWSARWMIWLEDALLTYVAFT